MTVAPSAFYLPENPDYTIVQSALDSARFALAVCEPAADGGLVCCSVDALPDGSLVRFRGRLVEGVGYCADSVFAAHRLIRFGRLLGRKDIEQGGQRLAQHVLAAGFFDHPDLPVLLYRDTESGEWLHNLEGRPDYLELGHIARVAYELLGLSDVIDGEGRRNRLVGIALRTAEWVAGTSRCANGWYPRRCRPDGRVYRLAPDAYSQAVLPHDFPPDPVYDRSGCGSLVVQLLAEVTRRGLGDYRSELRRAAGVFVGEGGLFGSTNTDTEDTEENVSYALGYLAFVAAADALDDDALRQFARERCLGGLERFEMTEDVNGLATKGLLWMARSWNSACMWEMAMAAQAYLVACGRSRERRLAAKALTILRGMAKHHHGPLGFLTEAVDWDGHSVKTRHLDGARYSDIQTTHPFLNNLHLLEPTVTYLERFAHRLPGRDGGAGLYDFEGNRVWSLESGAKPEV